MAKSSYQELDINIIKLDLDNPRIKMYLDDQYNEPTAEGIALALSGGISDSSTSFDSLQESIRVNGGIINPIIVNHKDGEYIVIEGNTRVQIYLDFKKNKVAGNWNKIRAIVYENLSDEEIHSIPLLPMSQIISFCGGKAQEIKKLVSAYQDIEQYYKPMAAELDYDFEYKDFSKFVELQNQRIINSLTKHKYTKKDFTKWVINKNIDVALKVRDLPSVLDNKDAQAEFLRTNLTNAIKKLGIPSNSNIDLSSMRRKEKCFK